MGDLAFAAAPRRTSGDATCMRYVFKTAIQMSTLRRKEDSRFWFGSFFAPLLNCLHATRRSGREQ